TGRRVAGVRRESAGNLPNPASPPLAVYPSSRLFLRRLVSLSYLRPVDHVPPRRDVIGAPVLVLELVGVLQHVESQHRHLAVHERAVLIGGAEQLELAAREG